MKNSWGPNWGENGYFKLKMGSDECGMESDVSVHCNVVAIRKLFIMKHSQIVVVSFMYDKILS